MEQSSVGVGGTKDAWPADGNKLRAGTAAGAAGIHLARPVPSGVLRVMLIFHLTHVQGKVV